MTVNILVPITITDAMLTSSSVAEPAASETAWVSAGTYALGDKRIRTTTHIEYECILAHTGRTALPEDDSTYWEPFGPTLRWAPFDTSVSTPATGSGTLSYVMTPGFFDAISLYGMVGTSLVITVKDSPGGTVLETRTISLYAESAGLYEYLFGVKTPKIQLIASSLPIHPTAEITLTITGPGTVSLGVYNVGQYRLVIGSDGGTQYGASVEPISTSRVKKNTATGRTSIKRGTATTGMRFTAWMPQANAQYALQIMQEVLDIPVTIVASEVETYEGLNVFGLVNAIVTYQTNGLAALSANVKGMF